MQEPRRLRDGSALELTVARWRTPSGRSPDGVGLVPDVEVAPRAAPAVAAERRGAEVLTGLLAGSGRTRMSTQYASSNRGDPKKVVIAQNKKARHDYTIGEEFEAGIVLVGTEVKSLRQGRASLVDAYAYVQGGEVWLTGVHIPEYTLGTWTNHTPRRTRKLLLNRKEIDELEGDLKQSGNALVPLSLYFLGGKVKVELGLGKGRKAHDKRQVLAERDANKEIRNAMGREAKTRVRERRAKRVTPLDRRRRPGPVAGARPARAGRPARALHAEERDGQGLGVLRRRRAADRRRLADRLPHARRPTGSPGCGPSGSGPSRRWSTRTSPTWRPGSTPGPRTSPGSTTTSCTRPPSTPSRRRPPTSSRRCRAGAQVFKVAPAGGRLRPARRRCSTRSGGCSPTPASRS